MGLSRLETYVLGRTLRAVAVALAVLGAAVMLIDFVEISRTVGGRVEIGFFTIAGLMLLKSPATILLLLPFIFLFGTVAAFVTLNRRSELVAMRAAGVSAWRFIFPAAGAAFVAGVLTATVLDPVASLMSGQFERMRESLTSGVRHGSNDELWLRQSDASTQMVIHADSYDEVDRTVRLHGVSLFIYTRAPDGHMAFSRRIEAKEARLAPGFWKLTDVREAAPGSGAIRSDSLSIPSALDENATLARFTSAQAVPLWRLPQTIMRTEDAGFSSLRYRLRLQQILALPLMLSAMSVLGAAFSLRLMRLGGLAGLAGAGVTLGFALFFFNAFCSALGKAGILPPSLAAWITPLLAILSGFTLLCYTEDG